MQAPVDRGFCGRGGLPLATDVRSYFHAAKKYDFYMESYIFLVPS